MKSKCWYCKSDQEMIHKKQQIRCARCGHYQTIEHPNAIVVEARTVKQVLADVMKKGT